MQVQNPLVLRETFQPGKVFSQAHGAWEVILTEHWRLQPQGFPYPSILHQLLCGLGTRKRLVNLEEVFRKFCAERWRLRALQWIKCNSSELQFWLRRNCAVMKSVVRPGQINVIHKQCGDAIPSVSGMWINGVTSLIFIISTCLFSKKISGWLVAWQQPMTLPYRRLGFGEVKGNVASRKLKIITTAYLANVWLRPCNCTTAHHRGRVLI